MEKNARATADRPDAIVASKRAFTLCMYIHLSMPFANRQVTSFRTASAFCLLATTSDGVSSSGHQLTELGQVV